MTAIVHRSKLENYLCPTMIFLLKFIFWGSLLALVHTYILYPILMRWLAAGRSLPQVFFEKNDPDLPFVSVIMYSM